MVKDHWDKMVRNCVTKLTDRDKYGILHAKLTSSERLKPHFEYLERIPESHPDKTYAWLSDLIDRLVADDRRKVNVDSLTLAASGKEQQPKKKPTVPGTRQQQPGANQQQQPNAQGGGGARAPGGSPGTQGPGNDPKGKGKGKGKDKGGKPSKAGNQGAGTDSEGEKSDYKPTSSYPGINVADVPKEQRCCLNFLWVKPGKDKISCCKFFNQGKECPLGKHVTQCTAKMKETNLYNRLVDQKGQPNVPKGGPAPPKKEGE